MDHIALLFAAGLLAGAMNALAGGGTFAAFPALLAVGLPPTVANATSNTALLPGAMASAWTYRAGLAAFGPLSLKAMFALTVVGGALGALLLHLTDEATFGALVPWLLLVASLALTFGSALRSRLDATGLVLGARAAAAMQFVLGVYGGYFGGAVGLMMMAAWVLITDLGPKELAPARTLFLAAANAAACVLFVIFGLIDWRAAAFVAAGAILGGALGARLGMRAPHGLVRALVLGISYVTTGLFFWRSYGG